MQDKGNDGFNYGILFESLNNITFALAFMSPSNATEKYYVLPSIGSEGVIQLTLQKDPTNSRDKYIFKHAS